MAPHLLDPANGADEADIAREVHKRKEAPEVSVDSDSHDVIPSTPGISHPRGGDGEADRTMPGSTEGQVQQTRASEWILCYSHFSITDQCSHKDTGLTHS